MPIITAMDAIAAAIIMAMTAAVMSTTAVALAAFDVRM
jgi:hypothetical protein